MQYAPAAVIDADVLLKLSHIQQLDKVAKLFGTVHVPRTVQRETGVHIQGRRPRKLPKQRQRHRKDVARFKRRATDCTQHDRYVREQTRIALTLLDRDRTHAGESEAIAQAVKLGVRCVLTDDRGATAVARGRGLEVLSTFRLTRLIEPEDDA